VSVAAGAAAFLLPESDSGDRNSDGDTDDAFVYLSVGGGTPQDLNKEAVAIAMSSELIAALVPSGPEGETFVEIYDWASPSPGWTSVGPEADLVDTVGSVVALRVAATKELRVYDAATAVLTPLGEEAEDFVLGDQMLAFRTPELTDLNGDGDSDDDVLQIYDLVSGQVFNSGQAVIPCRLQACDPRVPYRVAGDTVTFLTLEADQGDDDLNGDGDPTDVILQTFHARAEEIAEPSVAALAGTSAGVCTNTGEPCASNDDCTAGTCFVPPGGCIEDLGTLCSCNLDGCSGCSTGEFCIPIAGEDGEGTCHVNHGPCDTDADCTSPAICQDDAEDIVQLSGPLGKAKRVKSDGRQVFVSSGLATEATGTACLEDADCSTGEVCTEAGTCEEDRSELISTGAPDTDADGVVDPFDNCPHHPNADQADGDADGVGDACNRTVCRDGVDNDGDGLTDLVDGGCLSADDPSEEHDCSDGLDNDGDGRVDFDPATYANPGDETTPPGGDGDPGCGAPTWSTESPKCQDGIDNDRNGRMDHDAGRFAYGDADPAGPDPECVGRPWWNSEARWSSYCGLGVEVLLLPPLMWVWRRRRI
jgi:hypothetical protein